MHLHVWMGSKCDTMALVNVFAIMLAFFCSLVYYNIIAKIDGRQENCAHTDSQSTFQSCCFPLNTFISHFGCLLIVIYVVQKSSLKDIKI